MFITTTIIKTENAITTKTICHDTPSIGDAC